LFSTFFSQTHVFFLSPCLSPTTPLSLYPSCFYYSSLVCFTAVCASPPPFASLTHNWWSFFLSPCVPVLFYPPPMFEPFSLSSPTPLDLHFSRSLLPLTLPDTTSTSTRHSTASPRHPKTFTPSLPRSLLPPPSRLHSTPLGPASARLPFELTSIICPFQQPLSPFWPCKTSPPQFAR